MFESTHKTQRSRRFRRLRATRAVGILVCLAALTGRLPSVPAFPGAEGFGANATGGRGGRVIAVTNLYDSGPGSLRAAIDAKGPRMIVFRVSGNIPLKSPLRLRNGDVTIAGQTAPGDGVCLKDYSFDLAGANNVIIRHLRVRPGDASGRESDALGGRQGENIIIDHCSMSWSVDECVSIYRGARNFTVQWCLLSESLYRSVHAKGHHGFGGIWGGQGGSWHHNLLAHHSSRDPRIAGNCDGQLVDVRNNVIYDWGYNSCYGGDGGVRVNLVNNAYKPGPATREGVRTRVANPSPGKEPRNWWIAGNLVIGSPEVTADNWLGVHPAGETAVEEFRADRPFEMAAVTTHPADEAFERVLKHAGSTLPRRDPLDARVVEETRTGSTRFGGAYGEGKGIIDSPQTVGGWPELRGLPAPADTDGDGMPDEWERKHGFNPNDASDGPRDLDKDGYTNLEEYLNDTDPTVFVEYSVPVSGRNLKTREITRSELENKIRGYWVGQIVGNYFGFPFELLYIEDPVPVDVDRFYTQRNNGSLKINKDWRGNMDHQVRDRRGAPSDDDHDLEFLTLHAVEKHGLDITYEEIAPMLDRHVTRMVWVSTEHAVKAIRKGAMPPVTGTKENNPYWHDLMASISTEIWGCFHPGMTEKAAERAEWFGRISNDDYAIHLAKFYAAMYGAAFFESDIRSLIEIGRKQIPEDSILNQGIRDVMEWRRQHADWRVTRRLIYDKYYRKAKPKDLSSIVDALPNGLMGIIALLYADADFKKTLSISTTAGLDSDNQPATAGGLIGVMNGFTKLPKDYVTIHTDDASVFHDTYVNHTREGLPERTSMNEIVDRICNVAEKAILENGGRKKVDPSGETIYVIKTDFCVRRTSPATSGRRAIRPRACTRFPTGCAVWSHAVGEAGAVAS